MVYELEKEHKKTSLMCKKKEELAKEIMRLEHNVNVLNERLNVQANAIKLYEQESRNKAIDEFLHNAEVKIYDKILQNQSRLDFASGLSVANRMLDEIAEQLKGGAE